MRDRNGGFCPKPHPHPHPPLPCPSLSIHPPIHLSTHPPIQVGSLYTLHTSPAQTGTTLPLPTPTPPSPALSVFPSCTRLSACQHAPLLDVPGPSFRLRPATSQYSVPAASLVNYHPVIKVSTKLAILTPPSLFPLSKYYLLIPFFCTKTHPLSSSSPPLLHTPQLCSTAFLVHPAFRYALCSLLFYITAPSSTSFSLALSPSPLQSIPRSLALLDSTPDIQHPLRQQLYQHHPVLDFTSPPHRYHSHATGCGPSLPPQHRSLHYKASSLATSYTTTRTARPPKSTLRNGRPQRRRTQSLSAQ